MEKAIEIDRSLRLLADAGVQATYHACNVCDRAALGSVLERVRRADGPIDGILHGAGIDQACRFENKSREGVLATVGAKVDGAANLIALTRHDPVRFFVGFGSVAGRLGGNGQTDYCAASDMLCKLVGWYGKERPGCRAVGFHWTAWDEVGMASRPATKATLRLVNRQLIPLREGVGHLLRELAAGAPEGEVLIVDREYYEKFYRGDGAAKGPSGVPGEGSPAAAGPSTASAADPCRAGLRRRPRRCRRLTSRRTQCSRPASPAASAAASRVCQRYVLRMFDAPLAEPKAAPPAFDGPALILGDNPSATALCQRLAGLGVDVVRLPVGDDPGTSIAAIEDLWRSRPAKHLFSMTVRDQDAQVSNGPAWQRRRTRGILLPYLVSQRWCELLSALPSRAGSALVAVTALGGEFGLAGHVAAPEGAR